MKKITFPLLLSIFFFSLQTTNAQISWQQLGGDINGQNGELLGGALSLSADGKIMAVGAPNSPTGFAKGMVRVYEWSGSAWQQKGSDLVGEADGDLFGDGISLDSAGTTLAVGARNNEVTFGAFSNSGKVYVYEWGGSDWIAKGDTMVADTAQENFGDAVKLSNDGKTIAVGVPGGDGGGNGRGVARVFHYNGTNWVQRGPDFQGKADLDTYGLEVALSGDGTTFATGAVFNADGGVEAGQVRIYDWNGSSWDERDSINGVTGDNFGTFVSLSDDGLRLAVNSEPFLGGFGYIKIFDWSGSAWVQAGSKLTTPYNTDAIGRSLQLSRDGNYLIAGASNGVTGSLTGRAQVYKWNASDWEIVGDTLYGIDDYDSYGEAVAIADSGKYIAVGAPVHQGSGTDQGEVKVYEQSNCGSFTVDLGNDTSVCGSVALDAGNPGATYLWSNSLGNDQTALVTSSGTYYVDVTQGACAASDTIVVTVNANPTVDLGADASVCDGTTLDAGNAGATYAWSGGLGNDQTANVTATGTYYVDVTQNGCTGSDTITITVNVTPTVDLGNDTTVCISIALDAGNAGATYLWSSSLGNDQTALVTTSGTYYVDVTQGVCAASDTIVITIKNAPNVDLGADVEQCGPVTLDAGNAGATYLWNNGHTTQTIVTPETSSAITYFVDVTQNGCTSSDTIVVTSNLVPGGPMSLEPNVTACDSVELGLPGYPETWLWNTGATTASIYATTSGSYYADITEVATGCTGRSDTTYVTINNSPVVDLGNDTSLCTIITLDAGNAGSTYQWSTGATTKTIIAQESGNYSVTVYDDKGCAGYDNIIVTIPGNTEKTLTYLSCNPVTVNDSTYDESGTYYQFLKNVAGCDSLLVIEYTELIDQDSVYVMKECNAFEVNDTVYRTSGLYTINVPGCTATMQIDLTINTSDTTKISKSACDEFEFAGQTRKSSGMYSETLLNTNGCDSVILLDLTVNSSYLGIDKQLACGPYTWIDGNTYNVSNNQAQYYNTTSVGCDSIIMLDLTVAKPSAAEITVTDCNPVKINDSTYSTTGTYNQTLTNAAGCDSTLTVNFILDPGDTTITVDTCDSYSLNSSVYLTSGTYTKQVQGCPGTLTLELTIRNSSEFTITESACDSFAWMGNTYFKTGAYDEVLTNSVGCDSTITLDLTISPSPIQALANTVTDYCGPITLDAGNSGATYLWNTGETTQKIQAVLPGLYKVTTTKNACSINEEIDVVINEGWQIVGSPIFGEFGRTYVGEEVSMPDDNTVAFTQFSAQFNDAFVRVYSRNNDTWSLKGAEIKVEGYVARKSEINISMPDANTLAIGDGSSITGGGEVTVYSFQSGNWVKKGKSLKDVDPRSEYTSGYSYLSNFGNDVEMVDANTLAIGSPHSYWKGQSGTVAGDVSVFTWDGSDWIRKGDSIPSPDPDDASHFGWTLSMPDPNTIAISDPESSVNNGHRSGSVYVFTWNGSKWTQKGNVFKGKGEWEEFFGAGLKMPNANTIAIGASGENNFTGAVRIFDWKNGNWEQRGSTLTGKGLNAFGANVDMPDTNTIAITAIASEGYKGRVDVYKWDGTDWKLKANKVEGLLSKSSFGASISMPDTNTFVSGATAIAVMFGFPYVGVYELCEVGFPLGIEEETELENMVETAYFSIYPNPNTGIFTLDAEESGIFTITNVLGEVIYTELMNKGRKVINLEQQPTGVYFVIFSNEQEMKSSRVLINR